MRDDMAEVLTTSDLVAVWREDIGLDEDDPEQYADAQVRLGFGRVHPVALTPEQIEQMQQFLRSNRRNRS